MKCDTKLKVRQLFQMRLIPTYIIIRHITDPKSCQQDVDCHKNYKIHRTTTTQYTGCNRRNGPDFGRVFLTSYYTDITQNTYIQKSMVTVILAREV